MLLVARVVSDAQAPLQWPSLDTSSWIVLLLFLKRVPMVVNPSSMRHSRRTNILSEDIPLPKVEELREPVSSECSRGNAEHGVQLLEGLLLSLRDEEQHQEEADDVPTAIPPKGARRRKGRLKRRPGDGKEEVEEPRRGRRQRHADGPDVQRVCLGRVSERYWSLARGIDHAEEIDTQGDAGDLGGVCRYIE